MKKLTLDSLMGLEAYANQRADFRQRVIEYKKKRVVQVGEHVTLHFEDRLTMQYQIQEVLRAERIFERAAIEEELAAYNPLIPDGSNWKATMMIEFPNPAERRARLQRLVGIDRATWVGIGEHDKVHAIADEDLSRENEEQTSAVHFLRFELPAAAVVTAKQAAAIYIGISHDNYQAHVELAEDSRLSLLEDLD